MNSTFNENSGKKNNQLKQNPQKIGIAMPHSSFSAMRVRSYVQCNDNVQIHTDASTDFIQSLSSRQSPRPEVQHERVQTEDQNVSIRFKNLEESAQMLENQLMIEKELKSKIIDLKNIRKRNKGGMNDSAFGSRGSTLYEAGRDTKTLIPTVQKRKMKKQKKETSLPKLPLKRSPLRQTIDQKNVEVQADYMPTPKQSRYFSPTFSPTKAGENYSSLNKI